MKLFLSTLALFVSSFATAGYQYCAIEVKYFNPSTMEFIIFNDCGGVAGQELPELPKGVPSSIDVIGFDMVDAGRKIFRSQLEIQIDGNAYAGMTEKNRAQFEKQFPTDSEKLFNDYLKIWTDRGFKKVELIPLKRNDTLSETSEAKAYKYYEVYNLPNSDKKILWKMKIQKGRVVEPFKIAALDKNKEKDFYDYLREPSWTYTGQRQVKVLTNPEQTFVLMIFSGTWHGMYFAKL